MKSLNFCILSSCFHGSLSLIFMSNKTGVLLIYNLRINLTSRFYEYTCEPHREKNITHLSQTAIEHKVIALLQLKPGTDFFP